MGKKVKEDIPNPNGVANRDIIQRLNFLYQASVLLSGIPASPQPIARDTATRRDEVLSTVRAGKKKAPRNRQVMTAKDLMRIHVQSMKAVSQKTMVKLLADPTVKRTICKGCNVILISGSTSSVRVKASPSHGHVITYSCLSCKTLRRIPAPPVLNTVADLPPDPEIGTQIPGPEVPSHIASSIKSMDETISQAGVPAAPSMHGRRKKKPPKSRPSPFFALDVGHLVFRGNEKLELQN